MATRKIFLAALAGVLAFPAFGQWSNTGNNSTTGSLVVMGNVGIGNSSPQEKLDVAGTVQAMSLTAKTGGNEGPCFSLTNTNKTTAGIANTWRIYNMTASYGNSLQFWVYDAIGELCASRLVITDDGKVGIGNTYPYYKLDVNGTIRAKEIKVNLNSGADFVFEPGYQLKPLDEVQSFIEENRHLPEIPSAAEMTGGDTDLGALQVKLLQKIEELTLYAIQQQELIEKLSKKVEKLENNNQ